MNSFDISQKIVYVTLFCAVLCFDWSTQDKPTLQIKPPDVLALRQQAEACSKETGVPAENLKKIIDKTLPNDMPNKEFFFCVTSNTGYFDKNGYGRPEKFLELKLGDVAEDQVVGTVKECNKLSKENSVETAHVVSDCIHNAYHFTVLS